MISVDEVWYCSAKAKTDAIPSIEHACKYYTFPNETIRKNLKPIPESKSATIAANTIMNN